MMLSQFCDYIANFIIGFSDHNNVLQTLAHVEPSYGWS